MIEPLLEICAKRVADYIYDGELRNLDWKLDEKLSNIVFEQFYEMDRKITEEAADEISKKLNVTKMRLNRDEFDEVHQKIVFAQNLEQLHLDWLCTDHIFKLFNLDTDWDDENDEILHDLIGVLKRLLNENSLKNLQKLHISSYLEFQPGWVKEMSQLLPNIKSLNLYDYVPQSEFIDLCNCFTEITKLGITGRLMENLNGISNLKNLEILDLSECGFKNEACLMELFELKQLKVLVLSGFEFDSRNIKRYLKCGKFLPELRIMDCSFNNINIEMLEKLVDTHPKLEMISLIRTPINTTPQLKNRNVKLLTEVNLKCCLESLDHFSTEQERISSIVFTISGIIYWNFDQQTESDLRKLFNQFLVLVPNAIYTFMIYRECIQCLEEFCRGDRLMMFNVNERQSLIKMLLFISPKRFPKSRVEEEFHESLWKILNNDILLNTKPENSNEICERAAVILVQGEEYGEEIFEDCLQVMTKSIGQMKPERLEKMAKNWKLSKRLLGGMNKFEGSDEKFLLFLNLISELYSKCPTRSISKSREYINTLMKNVEDYTTDTNMQRKILKALERIVVQMNSIVYSAFFTKVNYKIILTLLSKNTTKELAISLLATLYSCTEEGKAENLGLSIEERVDDILKVLRKYKAVNDSDKFGLFQSIISTSTSRKTVLWAKWILSNFKEFQEPRPKRRRMQQP